MVKPVVVIFCRHIDENKYPFNSDYYWHAYFDLLLLLKERGVEAYFATDNATYCGNGIFKLAYTAKEKVPVSQLAVIYDVRADVVYDKGGFVRTNDVLVLNPNSVHDITSNKSHTYTQFGHLQPNTILCTSQDETLAALKKIESNKLVFKKLQSNGGKGVTIIDRNNAAKIANALDYPQVIQEFIDTSCGIPGLCEGYHDLRIKIGGGSVWGGTLRIPKEGELRANVSQGGTERHLDPSEIPEDARQFAMTIDDFFKDYPRYYAIDLAKTSNGWKLIELNSKPGLSPISMSKQSRHITTKLADYLCDMAQDSPNS